jgi:hypothetical protein
LPQSNVDDNSYGVCLQRTFLCDWLPARRARFLVPWIAFLALVAPADGRALIAYWPMTKVMRSIDDVRVRVGTRVVRINSETTLCSGEGRAIRRRGIRMWSRFSCTYTTFTRQGVDRDLEFQVVIVSANRFVIRKVHWISATR